MKPLSLVAISAILCGGCGGALGIENHLKSQNGPVAYPRVLRGSGTGAHHGGRCAEERRQRNLQAGNRRHRTKWDARV